MKSLVIASAALAIGSIALPAAAQTSFYGNVGYSHIDASDTDVTLGALTGKLGARFNPYVGVELEAGLGVKDDTVTVIGVPVKVELENTIAAFVVGSYPVSPTFELFARLGYGNGSVKASAAGASLSDDASSWNAGVGGQWFFTDNDGVRAEYTKWNIGNADDGVDANVWSASYVRKF